MSLFGDHLNQLIQERNIKKSALARQSKIPIQTMNSWLNGRVNQPQNLDQLLSLAVSLRLTIPELERFLAVSGRPPYATLRSTHLNAPRITALLNTWETANAAPLDHETKTFQKSLWEQMPSGKNSKIPLPATLPIGSRMLYASNSIFVGRRVLLGEMADGLKGDGRSIGQIVAVTGTGGLGKSQLATEFVHRYGQFFEGGVYWINFTNSADIEQELANCAISMGKSESAGVPELASWFQKECLKPVPRLLVFDNCEENHLLQSYRPITGGCRIVVTSRRQDWWPFLGVQTVQLDPLDPTDSIDLLRKLAPRLSREDASKVAEAIEHFPLALHMVGSYLNLNSVISVEIFLNRIAQQGRLDHPALQGQGSEYSPTAHDQHLARSFRFSWDQFNSSLLVDQLAMRLLQLAALLAPNTPLPDALLWHAVSRHPSLLPSDHREESEQIFSQALYRAKNIGLVQRLDDGMVIHGLVKAFIQSTMSETIKQDCQASLTRLFLEVFETLWVPQKAIWLPHIRLFADKMGKIGSEHTARLFQQVGYHLDETSRFEEGLSYFERSLALWNDQYKGAPNKEAATVYDLIGISHYRRGEYKKALPYYEQALEVRRQLLGPTHPETLISLNNLGYELSALGRYQEAEAALTQALKLRTEQLGKRDLETLATMSYLGLLYARMERFEPSVELLTFVYVERKAQLGEEHIETGTAANYLGYVFFEMRAYEQAKAYYLISLQVNESWNGKDSPWCARDLNNLGAICNETGQYVEAIRYFERALRLNRDGYGEHSFYVAQNLHNLGKVYLNLRDFETSHSFFEQAYAIRLDVVGGEHLETNRTKGFLGIARCDNKQLEKGRHLIKDALEVLIPILGDEHHEVGLMQSYLNVEK